jgi:hypothetical protein
MLVGNEMPFFFLGNIVQIVEIGGLCLHCGSGKKQGNENE